MTAKEARQTLSMEINDLEARLREIKAELSQRRAMLEAVDLMSQRASTHIAKRREFAQTAVENVMKTCDSSLWPQRIAELHLATVGQFMAGVELVSAADWPTTLFKTATGNRPPYEVATMLLQLYQPRRSFPKPVLGQSRSHPVIYFSFPAT